MGRALGQGARHPSGSDLSTSQAMSLVMLGKVYHIHRHFPHVQINEFEYLPYRVDVENK